MVNNQYLMRTLLGLGLVGLWVLLFCGTTFAAQTCFSNLMDDAPDSRYIDHQDGTVTDVYTGLMWKQCEEGSLTDGNSGCSGSSLLLNWQQSLQHAESVNNGSTGENLEYRDWRVPNIKELFSLRRSTCIDPALNNGFFPEGAINRLVSSTTDRFSDDSYRYFWATTGLPGKANKTSTGSVRLVRDATLNILYGMGVGAGNEALNIVNQRGLNKRTIVNPVYLWGPASVSSDGKKAAFLRYVASVDEEGDPIEATDLFLADIDGSDPINLTNSTIADEYNQVFSPDDSKLAFVRDDPNLRRDVMVINSDGTNLVNVTANAEPDSWYFLDVDLGRIGWSADGQSVYYQNNDDGKIYAIGLSGSDTPVLVSDTPVYPLSDAIAFSPDFQRLAWNTSFAGTNPRDELYTMDLATGAVTTIYLTSQYTNYAIAWSPDSTKIAIFDYPKTLTFIPADGVGEKEVLWNLNSDFSQYYLRDIKWSPDGKHILFLAIHASTSDRELYVLDIETGKTTNISQSETTRDYYGVWVPSR